MRQIGSIIAGALIFAFALTAGAAPPSQKAKREHHQVLPTGAEDAATAKVDTAEKARVDALIQHMTRKDSVGLEPVIRADGSMTVYLDDRFHHVARVVENDDGTARVVCDEKAPEPGKAAAKKPAAKPKAAKAAPAPAPKSSGLEEM